MRLLFVVDGRSPIALNWISYFVKAGHEVHIVSTYPCNPDLQLASLNVVPVALSEIAGSEGGATTSKGGWKSLIPVGTRTAVRQWLGPLTLVSASKRLSVIAADIKPDLIHAMRIPFEGMLATLAEPSAPVLVSVWGNDFTLHAPATPQLASYTRSTLQHASALHTDCERDVRLAYAWGYSESKPAVVLPGSGGVQADIFYPSGAKTPAERPLVINPRGFRAYVRSDTFFKAIPLILEQHPETHFMCPNMAGVAQAGRWIEELGIAGHITLLAQQTRTQMADLFRQAQVAVSPSTHDGTPNTLLEAMACGCFPVAGDLESLREWIVPGSNGLLFDPGEPESLAQAVCIALEQPQLRVRAAEHNLQLIQERAVYEKVMEKAVLFYQQFVEVSA
jgi:glycosyltransferase involved in cell wall biosynthesis